MFITNHLNVFCGTYVFTIFVYLITRGFLHTAEMKSLCCTTDDLLDHSDFPADLNPLALLVVCGSDTSFICDFLGLENFVFGAIIF